MNIFAILSVRLPVWSKPGMGTLAAPPDSRCSKACVGHGLCGAPISRLVSDSESSSVRITAYGTRAWLPTVPLRR